MQTNAHKSLLFTDMCEKKPDRFSDRLLPISNNILQGSTDSLTKVNSGYFERLIMVHFIYKRIDSEDKRQVQVLGLNFKVQN